MDDSKIPDKVMKAKVQVASEFQDNVSKEIDIIYQGFFNKL